MPFQRLSRGFNQLFGSHRLDRIEADLQILIQQGHRIMAAIDDLQAAVTAEDTTIDSAVTLLQGLSAALAAAGTDPTKLAALQADITAKTATLAAAVVANTPGAPPPAVAAQQAQAAVSSN